MISRRILAKRSATRLISVVLVLSLLGGCAGVNQNAPGASAGAPVTRVADTGRVVGIQNYLPVRNEPSLRAKELTRLTLGDPVVVQEEKFVSSKQGSDEWYRIAATGKKGSEISGWVLKKYVERDVITEPAPQPASQGADSGSGNSSSMKTRTTVEGALLGAAAGAASGLLVAVATGKSDKALTYALIGGAGGAAVGLVAGVYVANKKEQYKNNEEYLDACIKEAKAYNGELVKSNQQLEEFIRTSERSIQQLKYQVKNTAQRKQTAAKNLTTMQKVAQDYDATIRNLEGEIQAQEKALQQASNGESGRVGSLQREVSTMKQQVNELKSKRAKLNDLTGQMSAMTV